MDQQYYQPNNMYQPPVPDKRSQSFETASFVLGILALISCTCIYISIVCGALAIMFALLSRGGEMTLGGKANAGLILGIVAVVLTISITVFAFVITINEFGSLENVLRTYCEMYGLDFNELYGELFTN